ncbi:MAG: patatin-like phospholipase family protein [Acidiferrobacterales bacterium]|nr:patatin-like phospholipase family protein [Acidiferrobacterales bacterium]
MKSISLVLGSGGARGLSHIGIIRYLEENDYQIKSIAGSSAGALIGGVYAAGKLEEFEEWVCAVTKLDMVRLLDISWSGGGGFFRGDKFINALIELVGHQQIEDLPIHYTAVAADIKNEKEVWIKNGDLFDAIRASISLPLFFTPFERDGRILIDGGVLNPVPIAPTFGDETDITVAVNLGGQFDENLKRRRRQRKESIRKPIKVGEDSPVRARIASYIQRMQDSFSKKDDPDWGMYDVANQAFESMQSSLAKTKLAAYPPDHTIEIPRNACGTLEVDRAEEMIELGYNRAKYYFETVIRHG